MSTQPTLKDTVLPVGWNALVNDEKKTALIIGEYRYVSEAKTALRLITAKTEAELIADIVAQCLSPIYPPKRK